MLRQSLAYNQTFYSNQFQLAVCYQTIVEEFDSGYDVARLVFLLNIVQLDKYSRNGCINQSIFQSKAFGGQLHNLWFFVHGSRILTANSSQVGSSVYLSVVRACQYGKGAFNNYVGRILSFFCPPPPVSGCVEYPEWTKTNNFLTPFPLILP